MLTLNLVFLCNGLLKLEIEKIRRERARSKIAATSIIHSPP